MSRVTALFSGFTLTHWIIFASLLVVGGYLLVADIVVAANKVVGDTISEISRAIAKRHPLLPAIVAAICGHIYGPDIPRILSGWQIGGTLALLAILILGVDLLALKFPNHFGMYTLIEQRPYLTFTVFFMIGAVVWTQGPTP